MINSALIKELPLFSTLNEEELEEVAKICDLEVCSPDEFIIKEGEFGEKLFIIKAGKIKIMKKLDARDEGTTLAVLKEKAFFGELSLLDGRVRSASAVALTPTELVTLSKEKFECLTELNPYCMHKIHKEITLAIDTRLRNMDEKYVDVLRYMWL